MIYTRTRDQTIGGFWPPRLASEISLYADQVEAENQTVSEQAIIDFVDDAFVQKQEKGTTHANAESHLKGHDNSDIAAFFARPVLIDSVIWTVAGTISETYDIYAVWRDNPIVRKKIDNYQLFRGDFCFKVVTNGMPFHMGRYQVKWIPHETPDLTGLATDVRRSLLSQRPGTIAPLSPTTSDSFEFRIPFFTPKNYFNIATVDSTDDIGDLVVESLTTLKTANASLTSAEIQVYVWVENAEVIIPTATILLSDNISGEILRGASKQDGAQGLKQLQATIQNSDFVAEYGKDKLISTISSKAASALGSLTSIPIIGPYASVGSKFMGAAAHLTRWLGLSRPAIQTDSIFVKNQPAGSLAHIVGNETVSSLAFDSKQGITIDPTTVNLTAEDQMSLSYIKKTWSLVHTVGWNPASVTGTTIFEAIVSPNYTVVDTLTFAPSAMTFMSQPFEYWSGTIEYMFVFVVSSYHSGRVVISYDPAGRNFAATPSNEQYNQVVDIQANSTYCMSISWAQDVGYKRTPGMSDDSIAPVTVYSPESSNGTFRMAVLNPLKGPDPTIFGDILVYARPGQDYTLMAPSTESFDGMGQFTLLSDVHPFVGEPDLDQEKLKPSVFFGESINTFRNLVQRYELHHVVNPVVTAGAYEMVTVRQGGFPSPHIPSALLPATQLYWNTASSKSEVHTPLMTYLRPAYGGWRGSIRWKFVVHPGEVNISGMVAQRDTSQLGVGGFSPFSVATVAVDATTRSVDNIDLFAPKWVGAHLTEITNQPIIEYEVPFYNNLKFCFTDPSYYMSNLLGGFDDNSNELCSSVQFLATGAPTSAGLFTESYVAAGDDFDLLLFVGAYPIYL